MVLSNIFYSIKTKLIFLITIVITVISLFVYFYFPNRFADAQIEALENKVTTLAEIASYSIGTAINNEDLETTFEQLLPLLEKSEIEYLIIHLKEGKIFYQFNLTQAILNDYNSFESSITPDKHLYRISSPIKFKSDKIGSLYMGYNLNNLKQEIEEIQTHIKLISVIIFFCGVLAVIYIGFIITRPLTNMVDVVERIRGGNLSIRADINQNDEIGFLAKSFNSMVERIEESNEEMETINKNLEARVIERTKELNESKEKAESLVRMKTEFLAQMSHEIRTPINSILSYTQLLKDETINLVPHDLRFSFDMINNGGRRLIRTVDLILNMSELQTGTYEIIIEKCNIVQILSQLVGEFQTAAKSKNLDLMLINRLEDNENEFDADIYTITQIFANLIDNAIKYTVEGSIEVVVFKTENGKICIDVQDTGIGISQKFQQNLFDPFTQEEQGYTRKFDGNGLGMALVKEYCKLNNAKISVKSKKGAGSTFTVVFNNTQLSTSPNFDSTEIQDQFVNI